MLSVFRVFLGTWAARAFFIVLVGAFALWGVGDVIRNAGGNASLAVVGDKHIEPPEFQEAYRNDLAQVTQMMGNKQPTPEVRRSVAEQTLERLVIQAAIAQEVQRLGVVVPDAALRQAVFDMPVFHGKDNVFDRGVFESVIRNNGMTEARFLELMRGDLAQRQLIDPVQAGVTSPATLVNAAYAFQHEQRAGEVVELPIQAAPPAPAPTADDLQRYYENNHSTYSAPAYRRVKLVVLSPQSLARNITVSDADISAYYDQHREDFQVQGQRAANVIVAPDAASADKLAAQWKAGAAWAAMEDAAKAANATSVALDLSTKEQFPSSDLADAVFNAQPNTIAGPIKTSTGWDLIQVTKAIAGQTRTLADATPEIRNRLALERATDQVYTNANKLDDALSAGTSLDDLPGDLGLVAVTGTLDAQGMTPTGEPAAIPGSPALRQAIVQATFAANKGDAAHMVEGPDQSYYALTLDSVTPAALKPFKDVAAEVREDWAQAQRKRSEEKIAAQLLSATQAGGSLDDAATVAGLRVQKTPTLTRGTPGANVAPSVQEALFRLKQGETTMVETQDGFAVVRLDTVTDPDPAADPAGTSEVREALNRSLVQDVSVVFATTLRNRAEPRINRTMFNSLVE